MSRKTLNVVTYNIHKGLSQFNKRLVLHEIRDKLALLGIVTVEDLARADPALLADLPGRVERVIAGVCAAMGTTYEFQHRVEGPPTVNDPRIATVASFVALGDNEAAKIAGVTLQIVRDWVLRFNADGTRDLGFGEDGVAFDVEPTDVDRHVPQLLPLGHRHAAASEAQVVGEGRAVPTGDALALAQVGARVGHGSPPCQPRSVASCRRARTDRRRPPARS